MRGGYCSNGSQCGFAFVVIGSSFSIARWYVGAALSFKQFSSFYCDYFYQSANTKYSLRGGFSNRGSGCGVFCVHLSASLSSTGWDISAALSFKPVS